MSDMPVGPAGRTSPRGRMLYLSHMTPRPAEAAKPLNTTNPRPATAWSGPGARGLLGPPVAGRACVCAGPGQWGEERGGLGALPPWVSPGPAPLGGPPPIPFAAQGQRGPGGVWLRGPRASEPPAGLGAAQPGP